MEDTQAALVEAASRYLYPNYRQPPLVLSHGSGSEVWDLSGKRYLDFYAGIAVSSLGHSHPRLTAVLADQAARLLHVSNYFYNEPNIRLARELCQLTGLDRALFCNSGTEAVEAMLKLGRRYHFDRGDRERYRVIAFENSFHGRTMGALAVTGQPKYRDGFGPLAGVTHVPYGDIDAAIGAMGDDVAAVIVEPIQGEGGVALPPPGFLAELRALCDRNGALLLVDEVQTGVGRTGRFLACEHAGIQPDVVALAKALGGGVPVGVVLSRAAYAQALPPGSHGSTFAGNALASAAALAVLEVLKAGDLVALAAKSGEYLARGLAGIVTRHSDKIRESRGMGLLQALVLRESVVPSAVVALLRDAGLLVTVAGSDAVRFSPALNVSTAHIDEALDIVDRVLMRYRTGDDG
jgi:acetylornithine/N-succinyldiaminopimelate aminotransferase